MKKKMLTAMVTGVLSATMIFPAFATSGGANPVDEGTEVFAGIMLDDPDAKIKVEVPTLFAFVVNGTVDTDDTAQITVDAGTLLLPNVKVEVNDGTEGGAPYSIQTVGEQNLKFTNYSTKAGATADDPREGLEIALKGSIKNEGTLADRNNWEHVRAAEIGNLNQFKEYTVSVGGEAFSEVDNGGFTMKSPILIEAPELGGAGTAPDFTYTNMDTTTNLAINGIEQPAIFDVAVGGQRNQYKQVEQSAKVGTIVWTITVLATADEAPTSPDNPPLEQPVA